MIEEFFDSCLVESDVADKAPFLRNQLYRRRMGKKCVFPHGLFLCMIHYHTIEKDTSEKLNQMIKIMERIGIFLVKNISNCQWDSLSRNAVP